MNVEIKLVKPNVAKIRIEYFDAFDDLRTYFSTLERNFTYIKRCRARNIKVQPGKEFIKKSCIKMNGEFELGLLFDILSYCKNNMYNNTINFIFDDAIKEYIKSNEFKLDTDNIFIENNGKPRQYQLDSMQLALNKQNGLFILGTGAGKTLCTAILIHNLLKYNLVKQILLICPFPDLVNQTYNEIAKFLKNYNYTISKWYGKIKFENTDIVIAGSDILRSQFEKYKDLLLVYECLIVDEAHQLKANNKISDIISTFPSKYRYGFTGTLPSDKHDIWSLKGKLGPVRYNLPSSQLRDEKFLTPVKVTGLNVNVKNIPTVKIDDNGKKQPFTYQDEIDWLANNKDFNTTISNIALKLSKNTLILISRLTQGDELKNILEEQNNSNKEIYYIQGSIEIDIRNKIKELMELKDNLIVIAQVSIFSTGINVKNIHNIIFAGTIGKSSIRCIQSIGRGLRLNENKNMLNVYDVYVSSKYCLKHLELRKTIYEKEVIPFTSIKLKNS